MRMAGPPLRRLVDSLHLHSIHSTTVNREARDSRFDLAKIGPRQLNIDRSQVLVQNDPGCACLGSGQSLASAQAARPVLSVRVWRSSFPQTVSARRRTAGLPRGSRGKSDRIQIGQEARQLMLNENLDAGSAAGRVGYESASQFSREYSRLFGAPPQRDITRMRLAPVAHSADFRRTIARSTSRGTGPRRRSTLANH